MRPLMSPRVLLGSVLGVLLGGLHIVSTAFGRSALELADLRVPEPSLGVDDGWSAVGIRYVG